MTRRLHDDHGARAEARAARRLGLTMTQWDELDDYDRAWALGLDVADAETAAGACQACGGPASECQDPDNQHAYVPTYRRCYRTRAIDDARKARKSDPDLGSLLISVTLDPTKKKSAQEGARRG